jgi:CheY-like chemotaxis protein
VDPATDGRLPRGEAEDVRLNPLVDAEDRKTVLVIDDDRDSRDLITEALESEGYRVVTAADGEEALCWIRTTPRKPRVILLDLMMPGMDGMQLRSELMRDPVLGAIPVIALSADPSAIVAARSLSFGGYLKKPVQLDALLGIVHAHCA